MSAPSKSKRFTTDNSNAPEEAAPAAVEALHAALEASSLTLFQAAQSRAVPAKRPPHLPPFPSLHASPYVLCQHCSRLLLLPAGSLLASPPGTLLLDCFLYVKLKCGFCLNISKFSTRHLYRASSSSRANGNCSAQSMPICVGSNGVVQEALKVIRSEISEPINEPALESSIVNSKASCKGNVEHEKRETGATLNGICKHTSNWNHIETVDPPKGFSEDSMVDSGALAIGRRLQTHKNVIETGQSPNGTCKEFAQSKHVETGELLDCDCVHTQEIAIKRAEPLDDTCGVVTQSKYVETGAILSGIETGKPLNGTCGEVVQSTHVETESKYVETGAFLIGIEAEKSLNGTCQELAKTKHVEMGLLLDRDNVNTEEIVRAEPLSGICGDSTQSKHVETCGVMNDESAHAEEIVIESVQHVNHICRYVAQPTHLESGTLVNEHSGETSKNNDVEAGLNSVCDDSPDDIEIKMRVQDKGAVHNSHSDREQEITACSSVQDWVDSLSEEIGHESDNQLQGSLNSVNDCVDGLDKLTSPRRRTTLHRHFGYSSPSELFEKIFSDDEDIKARTESNSTASSSFSSTNACQLSRNKSPSKHVHAPSLRSWNINTGSGGAISSNERDAQRSLAGVLKKSLKRGSLLPVSTKTRVVVNGHILSSTVIKQAEERAGKLRPGSYWYDCKAGFWGVEGGPCLGILPPFIKELNYPMTKQCSNGDTQVYVNGRELHVKDLAILSQRGLSQKAGRVYALGFDGVLVDETTGLELKHLGKLAPTVEQKGKGFGMFMADVLQSKTSALYR